METAHRLIQTLRQADIVGRYGGEEFILMLPSTSKTQAVEIAQRLRQNVAASCVRTHGGSLNQTISVGIASFPDDAKTLPELIDKADQALYAAKKAGRNRVEHF